MCLQLDVLHLLHHQEVDQWKHKISIENATNSKIN